MNLSDLIKKLWDEFVSLFKKEPEAPQAIPFARIKEAGDWRTGTALWTGTLPLFKTRIYYLEVSRTSIADKRELGIKPPPSHTFKVYFFSVQSAKKQRTTVFVCYQNCFLPASSEDYIACEILGKIIARRLKELCERTYAESEDLTEAQTIIRPGQLPQLKLKSAANVPAVTLLGRAIPKTQANWQSFIDSEMQRVRDDQLEKSKKKGIG